MISRHTKILLLVAVICLGIAGAWERHSHAVYERSYHPTILYNLDTSTGKLYAIGDTERVPRFRRALEVVGMLALLFGAPLLVSDITHRRRHGETKGPA
jgi:hypothetical protein